MKPKKKLSKLKKFLIWLITGGFSAWFLVIATSVIAVLLLTILISAYGVIFKKADPEADIKINEYECTCKECITSGKVVSSGNGLGGNSIGGDYSSTHNSGSLSFQSVNLEGLSSEQTQVAQEIYKLLVTELGYTHEAASGVLGNVWQESTFKPNIWQGFIPGKRADNINNYYGLFQSGKGPVLTPKTVGFDDSTKANGWDIDSVDGQVRAMDFYSKNESGAQGRFNKAVGGYEAFKQLKDVKTATDAFIVGFENCIASSGETISVPSGSKYFQHVNKRRDYAQKADEYFKKYSIWSSDGSSNSTATPPSTISSNAAEALASIKEMTGLSGLTWGEFPIEVFSLSSTFELGTSDAKVRKQQGDYGQAYTLMLLDYRYDLVPAMKEMYAKNSTVYAGFAPYLNYKPADDALVGQKAIVDTFNNAYSTDKSMYASDITKFFFSKYTVEVVSTLQKAGINLSGRHIAIVAAGTSCNVNMPAGWNAAVKRVNNTMTDEEILDIIYQAWREKRPKFTGYGERLAPKGSHGEHDVAIDLLKGVWIPSQQNSPSYADSCAPGWDVKNSLEMAGQKSGTTSIVTPGSNTNTGSTNFKLNYTKENIDDPNFVEGTKLNREYTISECKPIAIQKGLVSEGSSAAMNGEVRNLVIHYMAGNIETASNLIGYFNESGLTSTFGIGLDGVVWQYTSLERAGYANDDNNNKYSIEAANMYGSVRYGQETYESLVHLTAWMVVRLNLSTDPSWSANPKGNMYVDNGDVQRHYDSKKWNKKSKKFEFRGKACPAYYTPNDNSAIPSNVTSVGGQARWLAFKEDVTEFIIKFKNDPNFEPTGVIGLEALDKYKKPESNANWRNMTLDSGSGTSTSNGTTTGIVKCGCKPGCECGCENKCEHEVKVNNTSNTNSSNANNNTNTGDVYTDGVAGTGKSRYDGKANAPKTYKIENGLVVWTGTDFGSTAVLMAARQMAKEIHAEGLKYNMKAYHKMPSGMTMRQDCSGYMTAIMKLLGVLGPSTDLSSADDLTRFGFTHIANWNDLRPGDVIRYRGGSGGHVSIFVEWVDDSHNEYYCYDFGSNGIMLQSAAPYYEPAKRPRIWQKHESYFKGGYRAPVQQSVTINGKTFTY